MSYPVLTEDGQTIRIVSKQTQDADQGSDAELLVDIDGNYYKSLGNGKVEATDAPEPDDTPAGQAAAAEAEKQAAIQADQAAAAEQTGGTAEGLPDPLVGTPNAAALGLAEAATEPAEAAEAEAEAAQPDQAAEAAEEPAPEPEPEPEPEPQSKKSSRSKKH